MAKTDFKSIDEYLAKQPEEVRPVLQRVRGVLGKALRGADEAISYQIPAFRQNGCTVIYFAGWKRHYSLYPATQVVLAAFESELRSYEVSKGTIRFPLSAPVPAKLIAGIAKCRAREERDRATAKAAKTKVAVGPRKK